MMTARTAFCRAMMSLVVAIVSGGVLVAEPASADTFTDLQISVTYDGTPVPDVTIVLFHRDVDGVWQPKLSGSSDGAGMYPVPVSSLSEGEWATSIHASELPMNVAPYAADQLWDGTTFYAPTKNVATEFTIVNGVPSAASLAVALRHNAGAFTLRAIDTRTDKLFVDHPDDTDELYMASENGYSDELGSGAMDSLSASQFEPHITGTLYISHKIPGLYMRPHVRYYNSNAGESETFLPLQIIRAGAVTDAGDVEILPPSAPSVTELINSTGTGRISGEAAVGKALTVEHPGDAPGVTFTYQWYVTAITDGINQRPILGATSQTYIPTAVELGQQLSVDSFATAPGYRSVTLLGGRPSQPVRVGDPNQGTVSITGEARVGNTVTAQVSTVLADAKSYQWYLNGNVIQDAMGKTYEIGDLDAGNSLSVSVRSTVQGHTDAVIPSESIIVAATEPPAATSPSKETTSTTDGTASAPSLAANPGTVSIGGTAVFGKILKANVATSVSGTVAYQWFRNGVRIGGADGSNYRVGAADLGSSLAVVARSTAQGYLDAVLTSPPRAVARDTASVRARSAKTISARQAPQVQVRVGPGASGVNATARVKVYYSAKKFKTVLAKSGKTATLKLPKLKTGKHTIKIVYPGTTRYAAKTTKLTMMVTR